MHNTQQGVPPGYTPGPPVNPNYQSALHAPVTSMQLTPIMTHPQQDLAYSQMQLAQEIYGGGDSSDGGGSGGGYSGGESDNAGNDTGDRGAY